MIKTLNEHTTEHHWNLKVKGLQQQFVVWLTDWLTDWQTNRQTHRRGQTDDYWHSPVQNPQQKAEEFLWDVCWLFVNRTIKTPSTHVDGLLKFCVSSATSHTLLPTAVNLILMSYSSSCLLMSAEFGIQCLMGKIATKYSLILVSSTVHSFTLRVLTS